MERREAIKWMLTAAASAALLDGTAMAAVPAPPAGPSGKGYGTDPDLLKVYKPGDLWALTFTPAQRALTAALCDTIIPADGNGPAASAVGVPDFIDEWISAPYLGHDHDRTVVIAGLEWLEAESRKRFKNGYANLIATQKNAICDDLCHEPDAKPEFKKAAQFFRRFRDLTAGGYYTTPEGMKDIGYTGNVALATYDGPPPEVLKKLGLA
ncbi:MAG: gluconate 2-dehydrogenase subunit 3 family protein [Opitutaceae bacterium]|nr:gluconate 2-dehydrogenase subunit 3 family protein [Opitutaceae bacterium]